MKAAQHIIPFDIILYIYDIGIIHQIIFFEQLLRDIKIIPILQKLVETTYKKVVQRYSLRSPERLGYTSANSFITFTVYLGNLETLKWFLENKDEQHTEYLRFINIAAYMGHLNIVKYLIEKNGECDDIAFFYSLVRSKDDVFNYLYKKRNSITIHGDSDAYCNNGTFRIKTSLDSSKIDTNLLRAIVYLQEDYGLYE